jgi:hypothetical protein
MRYSFRGAYRLSFQHRDTEMGRERREWRSVRTERCGEVGLSWVIGRVVVLAPLRGA